ncbi:MAG: late competence development ComFB family protein [Clostridiales bacterium]|jgi:competence protein ComFB|nr:late competence development ComFB family protein [Clostridiales bacterium]
MGDIKMKNYMEDCVADIMPSVLAEMNVCRCERCRMDIMAYVLNKLPPKYVVTRKGHLYTKLAAIASQFDVDIITAITQAATIVSSRPRHDEE